MKLNEDSKKLICDTIDDYLANFGKFNKNDFEVLIFQSILIGPGENMSNYTLSRELKITEAKVKKLRYEADLTYNTGADYEDRKYQEFLSLFSRAKYRILGEGPENYRIEFVIENPALRKFIDGKMKEAGTYTDSSFNTEIVRMSPQDLAKVLELFPEGRRWAAKLMEKVESFIKHNDLGIKTPSFVDLFPSIFLKCVETASNVTGLVAGFSPDKMLGSVTASFLEKILPKKSKKKLLNAES